MRAWATPPLFSSRITRTPSASIWSRVRWVASSREASSMTTISTGSGSWIEWTASSTSGPSSWQVTITANRGCGSVS